MSLIIKMAADQAWANNQSAFEALSQISENLNDIQLYLDENTENLPTKSEVSVAELFKLVMASVDAIRKSDVDMRKTNDWLNAIRGATDKNTGG